MARLFEGIEFSVEFGEHLFPRDAFTTVEMCKSFSDFVPQLLAPYLIELLSLFEQQKRLPNDFISSPYTFFLLNGDMELHRNRHLFIEKNIPKV